MITSRHWKIIKNTSSSFEIILKSTLYAENLLLALGKQMANAKTKTDEELETRFKLETDVKARAAW